MEHPSEELSMEAGLDSQVNVQADQGQSTASGKSPCEKASFSSVKGRVLNICKGDFGLLTSQGAVQLALDYDDRFRELKIYVGQCKNLNVADERRGSSNPYVKTYLLPDNCRLGKRKTSVRKRTVNPTYKEVLKYKIEKLALIEQKLSLSVWHNDILGHNIFLGETEIDLSNWDWDNQNLNWYPLRPRVLCAPADTPNCGVMNLSIKYVPEGTLGPRIPQSGVHIWVKSTHDLPQIHPTGVNSFVQCYVTPDVRRKSHQRTRIIKGDPNPIFNHTIVVDGFHTEDLNDACIELTVWDHEKFTNHFLGGLRLCLGTGRAPWPHPPLFSAPVLCLPLSKHREATVSVDTSSTSLLRMIPRPTGPTIYGAPLGELSVSHNLITNRMEAGLDSQVNVQADQGQSTASGKSPCEKASFSSALELVFKYLSHALAPYESSLKRPSG